MTQVGRRPCTPLGPGPGGRARRGRSDTGLVVLSYLDWMLFMAAALAILGAVG